MKDLYNAIAEDAICDFILEGHGTMLDAGNVLLSIDDCGILVDYITDRLIKQLGE